MGFLKRKDQKGLRSLKRKDLKETMGFLYTIPNISNMYSLCPYKELLAAG